MAKDQPPILYRALGLFDAVSIGINAIIGAGIFVVIGIAAGMAGPGIVLSIIIAGFVSAFTALSFAELSRFIPKEGGGYEFAHKLISNRVGFAAGWLWILSNIIAGSAVALGFAQYLAVLLPFIPTNLAAIGICIIVTLVNYFGIKQSARLNNVLNVSKIAILALFIVLGSGYVNLAHFKNLTPKGYNGVLQGASLIFFAYAGFARITTVAEEVKKPQRTIPLSIILSLIISAVIYVLTSFVAVGLIGYLQLSSSSSPLADAASMTGINGIPFLISIGAIIATLGVLLTSVLGVSRVSFAMARNGDLPRLLKEIHPKYNVPHYSVVISGLLMAIISGFLNLGAMVSMSNVASLLYYSITNVSAIKLRKGERLYPKFIPYIGLVSCLMLITFLSIGSILITAIAVLSGIIFYIIWRKKIS
ncbi:MAG: amino acid permease [archaeon]|nr:amino acid permease [archaeon]